MYTRIKHSFIILLSIITFGPVALLYAILLAGLILSVLSFRYTGGPPSLDGLVLVVGGGIGLGSALLTLGDVTDNPLSPHPAWLKQAGLVVGVCANIYLMWTIGFLHQPLAFIDDTPLSVVFATPILGAAALFVFSMQLPPDGSAGERSAATDD